MFFLNLHLRLHCVPSDIYVIVITVCSKLTENTGCFDNIVTQGYESNMDGVGEGGVVILAMCSHTLTQKVETSVAVYRSLRDINIYILFGRYTPPKKIQFSCPKESTHVKNFLVSAKPIYVVIQLLWLLIINSQSSQI